MIEEQKKSYRVLARKYRPQNFDALIGQDAMVRTLRNAIESGRIAQAYILTGVRGVGKTTTARIIAKALNYTGADGQSGPSVGPTDDCEICQAIAQDRHPDVMEMDAASRTGVDDIREIIEGVRYAPTQARYKVYIIDEIHMLSRNAFNALLKTLEEPPEHVIFIFATTEIRKVPITVLSRCQRFDLRRVDVPTLSSYYKEICGKENVDADDDALAIIASAADGSVRDGLSLLDQAMARTSDKITVQQIQDMLGLADRGQVLDILESCMKAETEKALALANDLYQKGADPLILMQDMLDFCHLLTRLRAVPDDQDSQHTIGPDLLERAAALSGKLSMPALGRSWQILLKGIQEVQIAPNPQAAFEMILIRLSYTSDLPDPRDLIKKLREPSNTDQGGPTAFTQNDAASQAPVAVTQAPAPAAQSNTIRQDHGITPSGNMPDQEQRQAIAPKPDSLMNLERFLSYHGELILASKVYQSVHLVHISEGKLEFRPAETAEKTLANDLRTALTALTQDPWAVSVSKEEGSPTLAEQDRLAQQELLDRAYAHPIVKTALEVFPGATVSVTKKTA